MISLQHIISEAKKAFPTCQLSYLHPSLYLVCEDHVFARMEEEERAAAFFRKTALIQNDAELTLQAAGVVLCLVAPAEGQAELAFMREAPASHHWIEFLANAEQVEQIRPPSNVPLIHFYGFKGGQARSTVLAMTAQHLASDGYRVLVVDADIEAPSLPAVFETPFVNPNATLFGCAQFKLSPTPQTVFLPKSTDGRIDMIACRTNSTEYDLDFAAFVLRSTLDPKLIERVFDDVIVVAQSKYDVILIDHRSGIATTVLPIAARYRGPAVICLRLDDQSIGAESFFEVLFRQNHQAPGLFVSFSLDPDENQERMTGRNRARVESLLQTLGGAIGRGVSADAESASVLDGPDPEDLLEYWVPWFHDRSFLSKRLPPLETVSSDNIKALVRLRELVGLSARRLKPAVPPVVSAVARSIAVAQLTSSGNTDQGLLIETEALRKLRLPNTPYTYILGRKGTGKTRLLRALVESQQGMPLLVADDFSGPEGVRCNDPVIKDLSDRIGTANAEKFWWVLLDAGLTSQDRSGQAGRLQQWFERIRKDGPSTVSAIEIARTAASIPDCRTFLIDGVETAFSSAQIGSFVEGLFQFLSAVQSNEQFNQKIKVRVFIRTDLARRAYENVEQQIEGRFLQLSWDTQGILNFVLSRIVDQPWFRENFRNTVRRIDDLRAQLSTGAVSESLCSELLLEMFPEQLRRNNLQTLTFLKTYFSDGVAETASYYPRVYDTFLQDIASPVRIGRSYEKMPQIEDGHVAQPLIIAAHEHASRDYLQQVTAELKNLLRLSDDLEENKKSVEALIEAFRGMPTPFELDACTERLVGKVEGVAQNKMRDALHQMKQVGIFEERPDYPGWWRVGRLFKSSLGMKYVRTPATPRSTGAGSVRDELSQIS